MPLLEDLGDLDILFYIFIFAFLIILYALRVLNRVPGDPRLADMLQKAAAEKTASKTKEDRVREGLVREKSAYRVVCYRLGMWPRDAGTRRREVRQKWIMLDRLSMRHGGSTFTPEELLSLVKELQSYDILFPEIPAQQYIDEFVEFAEIRGYLVVHRTLREENQKAQSRNQKGAK